VWYVNYAIGTVGGDAPDQQFGRIGRWMLEYKSSGILHPGRITMVDLRLSIFIFKVELNTYRMTPLL
jgi:hypothetical protein